MKIMYPLSEEWEDSVVEEVRWDSLRAEVWSSFTRRQLQRRGGSLSTGFLGGFVMFRLDCTYALAWQIGTSEVLIAFCYFAPNLVVLSSCVLCIYSGSRGASSGPYCASESRHSSTALCWRTSWRAPACIVYPPMERWQHQQFGDRRPLPMARP